MKSLRFAIPLIIFIGLMLLMFKGLWQDPKIVNSPLIDKAAPGFTLPILAGNGSTFSLEEMRGKVWVLNVWASWCVACRAEHPLVTEMVREHDILVVGLNYKDEAQDALSWLERFGDPYLMSLVDKDGEVGIDYGVYGVPESFVIDAEGVIRRKVIGPVTRNSGDKPENNIDTLVAYIKQLESGS
jgi:cytochrome c biogenesis protein CcmG, thiol:disulfide interchange protein DsbE